MPSHNELLYERIANELNRLRGIRAADELSGLWGEFAALAPGLVTPADAAAVDPYKTTDVEGFIASWVAVFIGENPHFEGDFTPDDYATILAHNLFVGMDPLMYGRPEGYFPGDPDELIHAATPAEQALIRFSWDVERQLAAFPDAPTRSYQLGEIIDALRINGRISAADAAALMDEDPATTAAQIDAAGNFESLLDATPQIMSGLALSQRSVTDLGRLFSTELEGLGEEAIGETLIPGWVEPDRRAAEQREAVEDRLAGPQKAALDDPAKAFTDALAAANPDISAATQAEKDVYSAFSGQWAPRLKSALDDLWGEPGMTEDKAAARLGVMVENAVADFVDVRQGAATAARQEEIAEAQKTATEAAATQKGKITGFNQALTQVRQFAKVAGSPQTGTTLTAEDENRLARDFLAAWQAAPSPTIQGVWDAITAGFDIRGALARSKRDADIEGQAVGAGGFTDLITKLLKDKGVAWKDLPPSKQNEILAFVQGDPETYLPGIEPPRAAMGKAAIEAYVEGQAGRLAEAARDFQYSQRDPEAVGQERLDEFMWWLGGQDGPPITEGDLSQATIDALVRHFEGMTREEYAAWSDESRAELQGTLRAAAEHKKIEDFLGTGADLTPASAAAAAYAPGLYENLQPGVADELQDRLATVMRLYGITDPAQAMEIVRNFGAPAWAGQAGFPAEGITAFGTLAPWPEIEGIPQVRTPEEMQRVYEQSMDPARPPAPPAWALSGPAALQDTGALPGPVTLPDTGEPVERENLPDTGGPYTIENLADTRGLGPPGGLGPPRGLGPLGPQYTDMDPYFRPELGGLGFPEDEMMAALAQAAGDDPVYLRYLMEQMPDFWARYMDLPRPGWEMDPEAYSSAVAGGLPGAPSLLDIYSGKPQFQPSLPTSPVMYKGKLGKTSVAEDKEWLDEMEAGGGPYTDDELARMAEAKEKVKFYGSRPTLPESEVLAGARQGTMRRVTRPSATEYFTGNVEPGYRRSFDLSPAGLQQKLEREREKQQEYDTGRMAALTPGKTIYNP